MKKPYLLGICGGSGSGKTFLLKKLQQQFPEEKLTLISQDNYYKALDEQARDEEGLVNFDHPDSLDLYSYKRDIEELLRGREIEVEEYTFNVVVESPNKLIYQPRPIIIMEGLFVFHKPDIRELFDFKVFVEAEEHIKIARRLRRDLVERDYSVENTLRDYQKFVAPMYKQFVEPQRMESDLIIPNNRNMNKAIEVMSHHLAVVLGS